MAPHRSPAVVIDASLPPEAPRLARAWVRALVEHLPEVAPDLDCEILGLPPGHARWGTRYDDLGDPRLRLRALESLPPGIVHLAAAPRDLEGYLPLRCG